MKSLFHFSPPFTLLRLTEIHGKVEKVSPVLQNVQFSRALSFLSHLQQPIEESIPRNKKLLYKNFISSTTPRNKKLLLKNFVGTTPSNLGFNIFSRVSIFEDTKFEYKKKGSEGRRGICGSTGIASKNKEGKDSFFSRTLNYKDHSFNTIRLDTDEMTHEELSDIAEFTSRLILTIWKAKENKKTAIWFQISAVHSHLISILQLHNFRYHHAYDTKALLYLWLEEERVDNIPSFATHNVGVGGLVLSKENRVLVVRERYSPYKGWKLPGGLLNKGEEFGEAIEREVKEETGIDAYFKSILMIRHSHNVLWSNSDIYVLCKLYLGENVNEEPLFSIDENELSEAKWMPLNQFYTEIEHPLLKKAASLVLLDQGDLVEEDQKSMIGRAPSKMYYFQPK